MQSSSQICCCHGRVNLGPGFTWSDSMYCFRLGFRIWGFGLGIWVLGSSAREPAGVGGQGLGYRVGLEFSREPDQGVPHTSPSKWTEPRSQLEPFPAFRVSNSTLARTMPAHPTSWIWSPSAGVPTHGRARRRRDQAEGRVHDKGLWLKVQGLWFMVYGSWFRCSV